VPKQVSPGGGDVSPAPCGTVLHAVAGPPLRGGGGVEIQQTLGLGGEIWIFDINITINNNTVIIVIIIVKRF
jgi:hypothetical protein